MYCHFCGAPLEEGAAFCGGCGTSVAEGIAAKNTYPPSYPPLGYFNPTSTAEVTRRHVCSPLIVVVASLTVLFCIFPLIDQLVQIGDVFDLFFASFKSSSAEGAFLSTGVLVASLLLIGGFVCFPTGICMSIYSSDRRLYASAKMVSLGTGFLAAALIVYMGLLYYIMFRLLESVSAKGSEIATVMVIAFIFTALFTMVVVYFFKVGGFFRTMSDYVCFDAGHISRIPGRGVAVLSIVMGGLLMILTLSFQGIPKSTPLYRLFFAFVSPWYVPFLAAAAMIVFAVFVLRFANDAQKLSVK